MGLLLMRVIAASALIHQVLVWLRHDGSPTLIVILMVSSAAALLAGLWTPLASGIALLLQARIAFTQPGELWMCILLGTMGAALALLGPGAWSVDAQLFGWKRIDIDDRKE